MNKKIVVRKKSGRTGRSHSHDKKIGPAKRSHKSKVELRKESEDQAEMLRISHSRSRY